ncbi:MAG: Ribonucleotide reductase, alpha subunit [Marinimicrobia bacterium 46_47]|nr:MAG: Ribonucleotide reductase, alpha subunit [Marinimicrobia bacterium 46_47]KUK93143.1 MAG: Ribonucleotide reductase, alpha subunit [Marinimicrobia bacterium 46_43]HBY18464.1 hypothetical protein [Candidatus Neomarinimicrobiota bacterium]
MLTLNSEFKIREVKPKEKPAADKPAVQPPKPQPSNNLMRPDVVDAKVYKVKSPFVKFSVYITLSYVWENGKKRPMEIFINSKDLTHSAEYAVLTRLISAIFRRASDPYFILEELRSIYDPNGGYFKNGKYIHSFYSEVADVIERFFKDEGMIKSDKSVEDTQISIPIETQTQKEETSSHETMISDASFKICPECNAKALKFENGCEFCVQCGYTRCDK